MPAHPNLWTKYSYGKSNILTNTHAKTLYQSEASAAIVQKRENVRKKRLLFYT